MIVVESVDYRNSEVTITDGKRSKAVPVARSGLISRMAVGFEVEMDIEDFKRLFFSYEPRFYIPMTALACVGYYHDTIP